MTKEDFLEWKQLAVTKALVNEWTLRIEGLQEELGNTAGLDPLTDRYKAGAIQAYKDLLNMEFEEEFSE